MSPRIYIPRPKRLQCRLCKHPKLTEQEIYDLPIRPKDRDHGEAPSIAGTAQFCAKCHNITNFTPDMSDIPKSNIKARNEILYLSKKSLLAFISNIRVKMWRANQLKKDKTK